MVLLSAWLIKEEQVPEPLVVGKRHPIAEFTRKIFDSRGVGIAPLALKFSLDAREVDHDRVIVIVGDTLRVVTRHVAWHVPIDVRIGNRVVGRTHKPNILDDSKRESGKGAFEDRQDPTVVSSLDGAELVGRVPAGEVTWTARIERHFQQLDSGASYGR